jgi:predicted ArsR family transcriptional regulator
MTGWKEVLTLLSSHRGLSAAAAADALGVSTAHVRVLLERCRQMGTVRYADASERPRVYVLTSYGRRRVAAGFKRLGKWKVR